MLLLHTVGRKSGKGHITPLAYYRDGDQYLVVACNREHAENPARYLNLLTTPQTAIEVRGKTIAFEAKGAVDDLFPRFLTLVTSHNDQHLKYQGGLARQIPVVILKPI